MTYTGIKRQLNNGLELRLEPSFSFDHDRSNPIKQGEVYLPYPVIIKKKSGGFDVSLYRNGKLCLGPHDHYYILQEHAKNVDKDLEPEIAIPILRRTIESITRNRPSNETRLYYIPDEDLNPIVTANRHFVRTSLGYRNGHVGSSLFVTDDKPVDTELISMAFNKVYPNNRFADKYLGHIFSIYFSEHKFDEDFSSLPEMSARAELRDNSFIDLYKFPTIMGLSYGYRARFLNIDPSLVNSRI